MSEGDKPKLPDDLTFHYLKSPQFREIFVEGAFGGVTPRGYISVALFKERQPIPREITNKLEEDGTLGDEVRRRSKKGIMRTVEANLYMDKDAAQTLIAWLQQQVDTLNALQSSLLVDPAKESN